MQVWAKPGNLHFQGLAPNHDFREIVEIVEIVVWRQTSKSQVWAKPGNLRFRQVWRQTSLFVKSVKPRSGAKPA